MHIFHERMGQFDAALRLCAAGALRSPRRSAMPPPLALRPFAAGCLPCIWPASIATPLRCWRPPWHGPGPERISTVHGFDHRNRAGISLARELWSAGRPAGCAATGAADGHRGRADGPSDHALHRADLGGLRSILWSGDLDGAEENIDRFIAHAESRSMGPYLAVGRGVKGELADPARRRRRWRRERSGRVCVSSTAPATSCSPRPSTSHSFRGLLALGQIRAEACLIDDAIRLVTSKAATIWYMPELLRMKG